MTLHSFKIMALIISSATLITSCSDNTGVLNTELTPPINTTSNLTTSHITNLVKQDTQLGKGQQAVHGKMISVHYTGWLYDEKAANKKGMKFDSSLTRGTPFNFPLGAGRVIQGWDQGFEGMRVGGKRTLIVPPSMGYGVNGAGKIPPNATLIFDVELLGVH